MLSWYESPFSPDATNGSIMNSTRSETQSSHTYVQAQSRTAQESQPQPSSYTPRLNRYVDSVPVASQGNVERSSRNYVQGQSRATQESLTKPSS
jgi:hypothetical protein